MLQPTQKLPSLLEGDYVGVLGVHIPKVDGVTDLGPIVYALFYDSHPKLVPEGISHRCSYATPSGAGAPHSALWYVYTFKCLGPHLGKSMPAKATSQRVQEFYPVLTEQFYLFPPFVRSHISAQESVIGDHDLLGYYS